MITNKYFKAMTFFFIFTMVALAGSAYAADITAKMQARLPAIKELKAKGFVGENNKGFLEFRGAPARKISYRTKTMTAKKSTQPLQQNRA